MLLNDDIEVVLGGHDFIQSVWAYDAATGEWFVYTPDNNSLNDDLHTLIPGRGYWLLALDDGEITIGEGHCR